MLSLIWIKRKILFFQGSSNKTAQGYLRVALDHMRNHGIKFHFTPQGKRVINLEIQLIITSLGLTIKILLDSKLIHL